MFSKSSADRHCSFSPATYQIGRGELARDTTRVLSRYLDGIMIRTYEQKEEGIWQNTVLSPIINGSTDFAIRARYWLT